MSSSITNNRRRGLVIGVRFTLITLTVAFLLFAGMLATAADVGRSNSGGNLQAPIVFNENFFTDSNFFSTLRFWERNRNQPPASPPARSPAALERDARPRENPPRATLPETRPAPVEQPESPAVHSPATQNPITHRAAPGSAPGSAPVPPPIPHFEHRGGFAGGFGGTHPSELPAHFFDLHERTAAQEMRPSAVSHVSYSFDARDWIDFFPIRQELQDQEDALAAIQATSLNIQAPQIPAPQASIPRNEPRNENGGNYNFGGDVWDGHATQLATIALIREEINRLQEDQPAEPLAPPEAPPVERPPIDLTPSFTRLLPHVQTCGVVVVQANFPLTEIASILEEIYMLQHDLTRYVGVPAPQEKIELCLFRDERSYLEFLREYFPRAPRDRRALFIKLDNSPGVLLVQRTRDFEIDLRHEMTHAIINASIPRMPIWLDEGLAKYFEVPREDRAHNHPYMREVRRSAMLGMIPSLDRLARLETIDDMGIREYRDSWAWTHFLIHRSPETHRLLAAYLQMLATYPVSGTSPPQDTRLLGGIMTIPASGQRQPPLPSLKRYLDEIVPNQRAAFRDHFGSMER